MTRTMNPAPAVSGDTRVFLSGALLYGVGYVGYMVSVQLLAMGLANRRLPAAAFGGFSVLYSFSMFFAALSSRWLQHLVIRAYPGGEDAGPAYWRWFHDVWLRGGTLVAVVAGASVGLLAGRVGITAAMPTGWAMLASVGLVFTHVQFEGLVGTVARVRRRFKRLASAFLAYAVVAAALAWRARTSMAFMGAFVAAGFIVSFVSVALEIRGGSLKKPESPKHRSFAPVLSVLAGKVAAFAAMSLAIRYLDRVLVGHFLGPEVAGMFFALNAGVMAVLLPAGMLGPLFHGWIARWTSLPGRRTGVRLWLPAFLTLPPLLVVVGLLARVVVSVVYPAVPPPALGVTWCVFCLGRILLVSRDLSEPLISRFGSVTALPLVDGALLLLLGVSMAISRSHLSLDAVNLLSGITLGVAGTMGMVALAVTTRARENRP